MPVPQVGMRWSQFLKLPWEVLATPDFFTVKVATWYGLMTSSMLGGMAFSTREGGNHPAPTDVCMMPCARQQTDRCDGFLLGKW